MFQTNTSDSKHPQNVMTLQNSEIEFNLRCTDIYAFQCNLRNKSFKTAIGEVILSLCSSLHNFIWPHVVIQLLIFSAQQAKNTKFLSMQHL